MKSASAEQLPIILVDDDGEILVIYRMLLLSRGIEHVVTFSDGNEVLPFLRDNQAAAVVLDLALPTVSGEELLHCIAVEFPQVPVIIITGRTDVGPAVACMREGACDYLVKPIKTEQFIAAINRARELSGLQQLSTWIPADDFPELVTQDPQLLRLMKQIKSVSRSGQPVLITGETGVGKELFAEAVHRSGARSGEYVTVNVAGLDDVVFSDTLFGHRKGAYTGADQVRDGLVRKAAGGTLFLDEIGDLKEGSQIKLLRLIQEQEYLPLGTDTPAVSTAHIVVATNRDLKQLLDEGRMRPDLYYRLSCHHFHIPPLRERGGDIALLLDFFIAKAARQMGKPKPSYPAELPRMLERYQFPGNVRELQAMVYDEVALHEKGSLSLIGFREKLGSSASNLASETEQETVTVTFNGFPSIKEAQTLLISEALRIANGNQGTAASLLGISRQALNNRLRRGTPLSLI
jgi:DNA-binding NtrC family response regulator